MANHSRIIFGRKTIVEYNICIN